MPLCPVARSAPSVSTAFPASPPRRARLPVAVRPWLGAVMISFSAVWVRLADVEVARSAFLRGAYALPVLAVLLLRQPARGGRRWLRPVAVAAGVLLGLDLVAWHASIAILGAGLGTVLPNLQVVLVGLAGVVLFGERPARSFWLGIPMVLAGIWLLGVVGRPVVVGGSVPLGVVYGLLTALAYAACLVVLRLARSRERGASAVEVLWGLTVGATLVTGAVAAAEGVAGPAGWPADGWLLLLALGSQVLGWLLLTSSIHRLPAAATSVALLLQPVLALLWGATLLGEPLGVAQLVGAGIVLAGVAVAHQAVRLAQAPAATPPVARARTAAGPPPPTLAGRPRPDGDGRRPR
jgi:drug/metabolite transporter (DMT)-like permease